MQSLGETDPLSVGGYPLFARLGAGGMGQVYLARTLAGRPLALKTVRSEFGLDPAFAERFAREIRHADRVRSPWTVTVVDFSPPDSSQQWLATEYIAAPSLEEWVSGNGPLPAASACALAAELCQALNAVHQAGLAHRDVKPSNVLLPGNRPLLIDFGIARAAEDSRHTRTGGLIGSPGYMSPEQVAEGLSAEPGDIFALGATLVYAATGRGPFQRAGENPSATTLLYRVVHEEPDLDDVPEALLPLVRACLAKQPGDRPTGPTVAELLPEHDRPAGRWAAQQPPGLPEELAVREADMKTALTDRVDTQPPSRHVTALSAETPPASPPGHDTEAVSPNRAPYTATRTAHKHPRPDNRSASLPTPVPGPGHPDEDGLHRGAVEPVTLTQPAAKRRRVRLAVAVALTVLASAALVARGLSGSSSNDSGGSGAPSTPARAPKANPNALPASWVGTWVGSGPGNPNGEYSLALHTDSYKVTLTLHIGTVGQLVGQQVSDIHDQDTDRNSGCTETLQLKAVDSGDLEFLAKSAHPTDPASTLPCPPGSSYQLSMIDGTLRLGPGSQGLGAPTALTRQ